MQTAIKWHHWLLASTIMVICTCLIIIYGWSAFATLTERSGLNGSMFLYYNISRVQYIIYNGIVFLVGIYMIYCIILHLSKRDKIKLIKNFKGFLILIALVIVCEMYLQLRFVGKG